MGILLKFSSKRLMLKDITEGLTEEEDLQLQKILEKWASAGEGRLSDKTFFRLAYTLPQTCVVTISLRRNSENGTIETLLLTRPDTDPMWPGMFNFPGKAVRRSDFADENVSPLDSTIKRIEQNELENNLSEPPVFVGTSIYMSERGPNVVFCYLAKLPKDAVLPQGAVWENVDTLEQKPNFIKSEMYPLKVVLTYFKALQSI
jgi:hypothetical protein